MVFQRDNDNGQPFNLWYTIVYIFNKNTMKID